MLPAPHPSVRILLLEDSKEFAFLLARWITHAGYQLDLAQDIAQAQHLLQHNSYDILLSDIELPSGDCFTFLEQIKKENKHLSTVIITAQKRADYAVKALRLRVDEFLFKPFLQTELIDKLEQIKRRLNEKKRSILAIGAHPDDVELGCGASLAAHVAQGDRVHILTLCQGQAGGASQQRVSEARQAAASLGASLTIESLTDTQISEGADTIGLIEQCIQTVRPQVIYTHSSKDGHQDHRNTFQATSVAARDVPSLLCYQSPSCTVQFAPTHFINIEVHLEKKQAALAFYASQIHIRPYMQADLIAATARYWGRFAGYGLCEAFEVIRARAH